MARGSEQKYIPSNSELVAVYEKDATFCSENWRRNDLASLTDMRILPVLYCNCKIVVRGKIPEKELIFVHKGAQLSLNY